MAFDSKTQALAEKAKIPQKCIDWFLSMDCTDCEGVAMLAAEEKLVDIRIIDVMEGAGIEENLEPFCSLCASTSTSTKLPEAGMHHALI